MKKNNTHSKQTKNPNHNYHVGNVPAVPASYAANQRVADRAVQKALNVRPTKKKGGW